MPALITKKGSNIAPAEPPLKEIIPEETLSHLLYLQKEWDRYAKMLKNARDKDDWENTYQMIGKMSSEFRDLFGTLTADQKTWFHATY